MKEQVVAPDIQLDTLDDVVACFTDLEHRFHARGDKRAVFATAYLTITKAMKQSIEAGSFGDNIWVGLYLRSFARLYVEALRAYEEGDMERVPRAWRVAFELGEAKQGLVIQHLVLGINAHVNHDLPLALAGAGIDPDRPRRYSDHTSVNLVLGATLDALQDHVERLYSPVLRLFDTMLGSLDDQFSFTMVKNARENAWEACLELVAATGEEEQRLARHKVDEAAGQLAELIAHPLSSGTMLISSLGSLESHSPIWLLLRKPKPDVHTHSEEELLPSLDSLHEQLDKIVEKYDEAGSEMAVYPAFYRMWLHILSGAVQDGTFNDPGWVVQLELRCARAYLAALADFESGKMYDVPHGWVAALWAAYDEEATIPQHMMLSVNARMSHDLPLLARSGIMATHGDPKRRDDLQAWRRLFDKALEEAGARLVEKYRQNAAPLGIEAELPERLLDLDFLRDFAYTDEGSHGEANEHDEDRAANIAIASAVRAHEILTRQYIGAGDLTKALKQIEAQYSGKWSDWI